MVSRSLQIPMRDGVRLAADLYSPRGDGPFPTLLIRSPYGRQWMPVMYARLLAQHGYHVLVQDVRGRFGSEGEFAPFVHEAADGVDTVAWMRRQPWFDGRLGTWGQSYLGYVQWALAATEPQAVQAIMPVIASSRGAYTGALYGVPWLELTVRWMVVLEAIDHLPGGNGRLSPIYAVTRTIPLTQSRILNGAFHTLPLGEADVYALGREEPQFRQAMSGSPSAERDATDMLPLLPRITAPAHLVGGWYDFMLPDLLADYRALRDAGRRPFLTIGPWTHLDRGSGVVSLREGLAWFDAWLKGKEERLRPNPVELYLLNAGEWLSYDEWPPPATVVPFYAGSNGSLVPERPDAQVASTRFVYDPADPTPALGGARFFAPAGRRDNRPLEARPDVITFTGPPLDADLDVVGPVTAVLYVRAAGGHADFFARLCEVTPDGVSLNVCDGIYRLAPGTGEPQPDGSVRIEVDMVGTAYRFRRGHRLRLQISGGAFPRFARNLGDQDIGAPRHVLRPRVQTIYHDAEHPSALHLPLRSAPA
jgi:putative CocE/NonD family hydrolase